MPCFGLATACEVSFEVLEEGLDRLSDRIESIEDRWLEHVEFRFEGLVCE